MAAVTYRRRSRVQLDGVVAALVLGPVTFLASFSATSWLAPFLLG